MKTIAYFFWTGEINEMFTNCIESYRKLNFFDEWYILSDNDSILQYYPDFKIIKVPNDWTDKRFYLKISELRKIQANEGDRIMVLDGDTLCLKPLDNFFVNGHDIILTTRHRIDTFKINAGVWGYIKNKNTDDFLNHAASTITNPASWQPYYKLKINHPWERARSLTNIDWPVDQDYLEIVYNHRDNLLDVINVNAKVYVHENGIYNCIVSHLEHPAVAQVDPYIVHFKNMSSVKWKTENNMLYN